VSRNLGPANARRRYPQPAARLTVEDVEDILKELARGDMTKTDIGRAYGVHGTTIGRIANGISWREVTR
jgi:DNA invertase Pin-like site-specific DNA recombinase